MGPHWTGLIIVAVLLLLLFGGRGKISALMGDFAKGITSFRKGLKDDDDKDESGSRAALEGESQTRSERAREEDRAGA